MLERSCSTRWTVHAARIAVGAAIPPNLALTGSRRMNALSAKDRTMTLAIDAISTREAEDSCRRFATRMSPATSGRSRKGCRETRQRCQRARHRAIVSLAATGMPVVRGSTAAPMAFELCRRRLDHSGEDRDRSRVVSTAVFGRFRVCRTPTLDSKRWRRHRLLQGRQERQREASDGNPEMT